MATNRHKVMVYEFHRAFRHADTPAYPDVRDAKLRILRARLILEEALEFIDACGCDLYIDGANFKATFAEIDVREGQAEPNLIEMADGLGDLDYVVQGANLVFGIPAEAVFAEIHRSNMSKLDDSGNPIIREDGKILKGPNYFKPRIAKILGIPEV